ncbi:2-oxoglutarate dehydrogenase E1 component [Bacillus massilinigeriensis]|uniref:2-oxoglutarate dehydrogenase E1 component n=1 Tax=Bacillus massilionigeriensis TaxID=1805475 RepID=UPI00096ADF9E|nr:2-oxoglutarate dehydrogenase E1 component [Bacillus massilionigeriensis]
MGKPKTGEVPGWQGFLGPNLGYVIEQYEMFVVDPASVDPEMRKYFDEWGPPHIPAPPVDSASPIEEKSQPSLQTMNKFLNAVHLSDRIRSFGHLAANIYPLNDHERNDELIDMASYDLNKEDLEKIPASFICMDAPSYIQNGYEAIQYLKSVYTGTIAFEFHHVHDVREKLWLRQKVESGSLLPRLSNEERLRVYKRLTEVDSFERFLHKTYVGQKRFSIEGLDTLVPILDEIISESVQEGTKAINIGMAHRGRLNVLAHVLGKPYEMIFAEFQHAPNKELVPSEGSIGINFGWTGDVKYHLGIDRHIKKENTTKARLTLANNPSHLEFAGAVVEGFTRAAQDSRTEKGYAKEDVNSALAILIHGDAAFPGQGIVAETLNLGQLKGYRTGGTIHIIANNKIGFTTEYRDSRSTRYSSDLAKGYEIPIIHVNADDPEACLLVGQLAWEYRAQFHKDILIDLVGYRRYGHNEMDEPMNTNPVMYNLIHQHPRVKELYEIKLKKLGVLSEDKSKEIDESIQSKLKEAYDKVPEKRMELTEMNPPVTVEKGIPKVNTAVDFNQLVKFNQELLNWPKNFQVYSKLEKILNRRRDALEANGKIDWGLAESLAFASIISEGTPVRLTGQDSERGTFAQRNLVLHDYMTGKKFSPLHTLSTAKASFAIYNSPLSEGSVLGFEYGYNVFAPETLVLWEAQYGDFANAAQVMFDQFISAGRAKWGQKSGLVMLLPHGYEGQGPEHSSGRMERFLTLAAENNWTVANLTSAAQYFHILRRQAAILGREEVRPLVLMSPKSLLRNPLVSSSPEDLSEGKFRTILEQKGLGNHPEKVERIVFGSGKIMIELEEKMNKDKETLDWIHILRVEQIYPFPFEVIQKIVSLYPNVKEFVWIQEEPKNMGAWNFVEPRLKHIAGEEIEVNYIGRRRRSSPAEGDPNIHKKEQARIIEKVFTRKEEGGN